MSIPPVRRFTQPHSGETWTDIAARTLPDLPTDQAVEALESWNLHITFRPPPFWLTPSDIVFLEPPGSP